MPCDEGWIAWVEEVASMGVPVMATMLWDGWKSQGIGGLK
jgi:hypothetical protein